MSFKRYQQNEKKHENTTKPVLNKAHALTRFPRPHKEKASKKWGAFFIFG